VHPCTVQALRLYTGPTAHRGSRVIALLFLDHGTREGEGSASRSVRSLPTRKNRYPFYRRLGGPQGRSGQVLKISPPPGFDLRTVQPVASQYADYTTCPTRTIYCRIKEWLINKSGRIRNEVAVAWNYFGKHLVSGYPNSWLRYIPKFSEPSIITTRKWLPLTFLPIKSHINQYVYCFLLVRPFNNPQKAPPDALISHLNPIRTNTHHLIFIRPNIILSRIYVANIKIYSTNDGKMGS